jgi:hypothetical protein
MRRVVIVVYQQWPLEPQSAPATRGTARVRSL